MAPFSDRGEWMPRREISNGVCMIARWQSLVQKSIFPFRTNYLMRWNWWGVKDGKYILVKEFCLRECWRLSYKSSRAVSSFWCSDQFSINSQLQIFIIKVFLPSQKHSILYFSLKSIGNSRNNNNLFFILDNCLFFLFLFLSLSFCNSVKTDLHTGKAVSRLYIANANRHDSGNYTCAIGDFAKVTVAVHVLNGKLT